MSTQTRSELHDVHMTVTLQFIKQLEKGIVPWQISWSEHPQNITGYPFDHINVWLLAHLPYARKVFLTEKQMRRLRVFAKKGERGHTIVGIRHGKARPSFFCTEVYNAEQVQGLYDEALPTRNLVRNPKDRCQTIVAEMPKLPAIFDDPAPAYYSPVADSILIPPKSSFESDAQYYSSLFYALAASTGHPSRRNRDTAIHRHRADAKDFSLEELIVEMAASYLCSCSGIAPWYISKYHGDCKGWLRVLQADKTLVITAAMYAQEAVNYIRNRSPLANPIQTGVYVPNIRAK